jgi:hypothetical protein
VNARLWLLCAVGLLACDRNVVVGYGAAANTKDASDTSDTGDVRDASDAFDAGKRDAAVDAGRRDAGVDADRPLDAGSPADAGESDAAIVEPPVTWKTGAHAGNDLQEYLDFGTWRGRPLDIVNLYPDRSSWAGLVSPGWPVDMFSSFEGDMLLSVSLYPEGMGNNQDCAAGMYDAQWKMLGTFLVDRKRENAILRLGWGPNDTNHEWRADADPSDWIACFRRVVSAVRSTDPNVQIDWSFNAIGADYVTSDDPYTTYPGDDYVDYVGIEAFDMYPPATDEATWDEKCNGLTGLCSVIDFARVHGKKAGIAEWGVAACGGDPGGDNPFFVRKMFEKFAENSDVMGYEAYFEDGGAEVCSSISDDKSPKAAAKYKALYGPR